MIFKNKLFNNRYLRVEIADTPSSHARGLMFRKKLDDDAGMAFIFNKPQNLKFWGYNTYIPLDIAFISPDNTIIKIEHISPLSNKVVTSDDDCNMAIESNYNFFSKNKIRLGYKVDIVDNNNGEKFIKFYIGDTYED